MKRLRPSIIPGILGLGIATYLLTIPGNQLPSESWLDAIYFDKWVHIGMFSLLVFSWCWGLLRWDKTTRVLVIRFTLVAILLLGYGIAMEYVQRDLVVNRSFDRSDIVADGVGCLLGWGYSRYRFIKK